LLASFRNESPKLVAASELQLLLVHAFNANDERNGFAISGDDDTFVLRVAHAGIEVGAFQVDLYHSISSVVLWGGL